MLKCVVPSVLIKNTWAAVCNLMKRHDAKRTLNSWGIQLKCVVDDGKEITKLSRPPHMEKKISKNWSIEEITCELQDLWNKFFLFIFGQLCDKKTFAFVVMGIGKKLVWAGGGMGKDHYVDSVLFVGVCVFVGWRVGWVWLNQASDIVLLWSFPLLWNIPCPFLDIFCFNKAAIAFGH